MWWDGMWYYGMGCDGMGCDGIGMWCDVMWCDGMVWYGMVWYGMVWYDMIWYDMIYDMIWYDMIWSTYLRINLNNTGLKYNYAVSVVKISLTSIENLIVNIRRVLKKYPPYPCTISAVISRDILTSWSVCPSNPRFHMFSFDSLSRFTENQSYICDQTRLLQSFIPTPTPSPWGWIQTTGI